MTAYVVPEEGIKRWFDARVGRRVYVKVQDGGEYVGHIAADSPVGTVALVGWTFRAVLRERDIVGVEDAS